VLRVATSQFLAEAARVANSPAWITWLGAGLFALATWLFFYAITHDDST